MFSTFIQHLNSKDESNITKGLDILMNELHSKGDAIFSSNNLIGQYLRSSPNCTELCGLFDTHINNSSVLRSVIETITLLAEKKIPKISSFIIKRVLTHQKNPVLSLLGLSDPRNKQSALKFMLFVIEHCKVYRIFDLLTHIPLHHPGLIKVFSRSNIKRFEKVNIQNCILFLRLFLALLRKLSLYDSLSLVIGDSKFVNAQIACFIECEDREIQLDFISTITECVITTNIRLAQKSSFFRTQVIDGLVGDASNELFKEVSVLIIALFSHDSWRIWWSSRKPLALQIFNSLRANIDSIHLQLLITVLKFHTDMVPSFIEQLTISFDASNSENWFGNMRLLRKIYSLVDWKKHANFVLFPRALSRSALSKACQHSDLKIVSCALRTIHSIIQFFLEICDPNDIIRRSLLNHLPDIQVILALKNRFVDDPQWLNVVMDYQSALPEVLVLSDSIWKFCSSCSDWKLESKKILLDLLNVSLKSNHLPHDGFYLESSGCFLSLLKLALDPELRRNVIELCLRIFNQLAVVNCTSSLVLSVECAIWLNSCSSLSDITDFCVLVDITMRKHCPFSGFAENVISLFKDYKRDYFIWVLARLSLWQEFKFPEVEDNSIYSIVLHLKNQDKTHFSSKQLISAVEKIPTNTSELFSLLHVLDISSIDKILSVYIYSFSDIRSIASFVLASKLKISSLKCRSDLNCIFDLLPIEYFQKIDTSFPNIRVPAQNDISILPILHSAIFSNSSIIVSKIQELISCDKIIAIEVINFLLSQSDIPLDVAVSLLLIAHGHYLVSGVHSCLVIELLKSVYQSATLNDCFLFIKLIEFFSIEHIRHITDLCIKGDDPNVPVLLEHCFEHISCIDLSFPSLCTISAASIFESALFYPAIDTIIPTLARNLKYLQKSPSIDIMKMLYSHITPDIQSQMLITSLITYYWSAFQYCCSTLALNSAETLLRLSPIVFSCSLFAKKHPDVLFASKFIIQLQEIVPLFVRSVLLFLDDQEQYRPCVSSFLDIIGLIDWSPVNKQNMLAEMISLLNRNRKGRKKQPCYTPVSSFTSSTILRIYMQLGSPICDNYDQWLLFALEMLTSRLKSNDSVIEALEISTSMLLNESLLSMNDCLIKLMNDLFIPVLKHGYDSKELDFLYAVLSSFKRIACANPLSDCLASVIPPNRLLLILLSHSKAMDVLLNVSPLYLRLLDIFHVFFCRGLAQPDGSWSSVLDIKHIPSLISILLFNYSGSDNECDSKTLSILRVFEANGMSLRQIFALDIFNIQNQKVFRETLLLEATEGSIKPLTSDLEFCRGFNIPMLRNGPCKDGYNPEFVLSYSYLMWQEKPTSGATFLHQLRLFVETGFVSYLILTLASSKSMYREHAANILGLILNLLYDYNEQFPLSSGFQYSPFPPHTQIFLLLDVLKNSLSKQGMVIPPLSAVFLANSIAVLCDPSHSLYPQINKYLLRRPDTDLNGLPLFYECLLSPIKSNNRIWLLKMLSTAISIQSDDSELFPLRRFRVFSLLMSSVNLQILNKQESREFKQFLIILQSLFTFKKDSFCQYLCQEHGLIPWLSGIMNHLKGFELIMVYKIVISVCNLVRSCEMLELYPQFAIIGALLIESLKNEFTQPAFECLYSISALKSVIMDPSDAIFLIRGNSLELVRIIVDCCPFDEDVGNLVVDAIYDTECLHSDLECLCCSVIMWIHASKALLSRMYKHCTRTITYSKEHISKISL